MAGLWYKKTYMFTYKFNQSSSSSGSKTRATEFFTGNKADMHPSKKAGMICAPLMTCVGSKRWTHIYLMIQPIQFLAGMHVRTHSNIGQAPSQTNVPTRTPSSTASPPLHTWMGWWDVCMEYPDHVCIPVWLHTRSCLQRLDHDVGVCPQIYGVPITPDIIGCIVDLHCLAMIDLVPRYMYSIPLIFREVAITIPLIVPIKQSSK